MLKVSGEWRDTPSGAVYVARAVLGRRQALARGHLGAFTGMNLLAYSGGLGLEAIETAARNAAADLVRTLPA